MLDRIFAALMFFTRLPFWRLRTVDSRSFRHVVNFWPFAGWITGGCMAAAFWLGSLLLPVSMAAWLAIGARLLVTGALHEDGLADFCDAFGGSHPRERTLAIMKDSHIGTYGVLGLTVYVGLLYASLTALPRMMAPMLILSFDVYGKGVASFLIQQLPYARNEAEAKARVVYEQPTGRKSFYHTLRCLLALLPVVVWNLLEPAGICWWMLLVPIGVELALTAWMKRRIGGYTGDCCGALFLLCELSAYLIYIAVTFSLPT